jgi:ComF family protein
MLSTCLGEGEKPMVFSDSQTFFRDLWHCFWATLFPPRCPICGTLGSVPFRDEGKWAFDTAYLFCEDCREGITPVVPPFCSQCGLPFVSKQGPSHTCSACLVEERYFRKARAFGVYDGSLLEAIHRFKYGRKLSLARPLAALVRRTFFQFWDKESIDLIVPVPLHVTRLRERGFNQAFLLITRWATHEGLCFDGLTLWRRRQTDPQTGLTRKGRLRNMQGAFAVRKPKAVRDKRILLIDDVVTTGATVNACAEALMEVGAASVDVLTLARAV